MNKLSTFLLSSMCLAISWLIFGVLHYIDGADICEIGYRNCHPKYKSNQNLSIGGDKLLYWSLCKNAKRNRKVIWLYFGMNAFLIICAVISFVLWVVMHVSSSWHEIVKTQVGFLMAAIILHTAAHFVLDLLFLPSERKRRFKK